MFLLTNIKSSSFSRQSQPKNRDGYNPMDDLQETILLCFNHLSLNSKRKKPENFLPEQAR